MDIRDDLIRIFKDYLALHETADQAAKALGVSPASFSRWLNGVNLPNVESILPAFDQLGARIYLAGDPIPDGKVDTAGMQREIRAMNVELEKMKHEKAKAEGKVEILTELLHEAQKKSESLSEQLREVQSFHASRKDASPSGANETIEKSIKAV